jgi:LysM repeat protein
MEKREFSRRIFTGKQALLLLAFCLLPILAFSQENVVPVTRSKDKVLIDGKAYYVHVVKQGETMYSISKAYSVPVSLIEQENPMVLTGLRSDMSLKIPVMEQAVTRPSQAMSTEPVLGEGITHSMEPHETLYSVSRMYHVSVDDILKINPGLNINDIPVGTVIKIQQKIENQPPEVGSQDSACIYHWVNPKETLFSLSKKYNIPIDDIKAANDGLPEGLKSGTVIKIPQGKTTAVAAEKPEDISRQARTTESFTGETNSWRSPCDTIRFTNQPGTLNVALLLPFYLDENDKRTVIDSTQVNSKGDKIYKVLERPKDWIYPHSYNYLEFYEGALLALDSLAKRGLSVNLSVFDTSRDSSVVSQLTGNGSLDNMDLIIGPVFTSHPAELPVVANYAKERRIPVVSPLSSNSDILSFNPYVFQVQGSINTELQKAAEYLSAFYDKHLVIVYAGDSAGEPDLKYFKKNLKYQFINYTGADSIPIGEVVYNQLMPKTDSTNILRQAMLPDQQNIVIVLSYNEGFTSKVLSNLNTMAEEFPMTVFGFSNWLHFENIDLEYFYNLHVHVITNHLIDYERKDIKRFLKDYRKKYQTEPSSYSTAWDGYDIFFFFLSAMQKYGRDFSYCIRYYQQPLLHTDMQFKRKYFFDGFENDSFFIVSFEPGWKMQKTRISGL